MAITNSQLKVSEEVTSGNTVADEITPANGAEVWVLSGQIAAAYSSNSVCKVVWKYNHVTETEEILWSSKGDALLSDPIEITNADGTRKLAVVAENGDAGALVLFISCDIRVKT